MTLPELKTLCFELGLEAAHLDDLVHDLVSKQASAINNGGIEDQLEYLQKELGSDVEKELKKPAE